MADASNRDGSMTNIFNGPVGNVAGSAQDGASQHYNDSGEAIAPTQGNGKLAQADGEGLLTKVLGPTAVQAGKLGKLKMLCWSLECFDATWGRASEILQKLGMDPKPIKLKLLKDLMDGATAEEEPELQELWANLIAFAASEGTTHPAFAQILSQLSVSDALYLQQIAGYKSKFYKDPEHEMSLMNLERLRFCQMHVVAKSQLNKPPVPVMPSSLSSQLLSSNQSLNVELYDLTLFGRSFLTAVQGPQVST